MKRKSHYIAPLRLGTTFVECIVAGILLMTAMGLILRYQTKAALFQSEQLLQTKAELALLSAREIIASWDIERVNRASIESLPMFDEMSESDIHAQWVASVIDVQEPIVGKRVSLGIEWTIKHPFEPKAHPLPEPLALATVSKSSQSPDPLALPPDFQTPRLDFWIPINRDAPSNDVSNESRRAESGANE
ncbi:MAG: hypothetical protein SGI77_19855 [Pirellulaceae bacterium]|nr:hypothetical protein [Pirellulaceae bacterium]